MGNYSGGRLWRLLRMLSNIIFPSAMDDSVPGPGHVSPCDLSPELSSPSFIGDRGADPEHQVSHKQGYLYRISEQYLSGNWNQILDDQRKILSMKYISSSSKKRKWCDTRHINLGWAKWKNISETVQISSLFIPGHKPDNEWWPAPSCGLQILFSLSKHVVFLLLVNLLESEVWIITRMGDIMDMRAPQLWRRPHAKIYGYNQDFSANYYSVRKWWIIQNLF